MTNKDLLTHFRHQTHIIRLERGKDYFKCREYYNYMRRPGYHRHHAVEKSSDFWLLLLKAEPHWKIPDVKEPYNADVFANGLFQLWVNLLGFFAHKKPSISTVGYFKQKGLDIFATWLNLIEKIKEVK